MRSSLYFVILIISMIKSEKICSKDESRFVREYFRQILLPIYHHHHLQIPFDCSLHPSRDFFYQHEIHKTRLGHKSWLCQYCNRTFPDEYHLDLHLTNRHNETLVHNENSICFAEFCSIFRCEILRRSKYFHRTTDGSKSKVKKAPQDHQLTILRSRCASLINQCVPTHLHQNMRIQLQHELYGQLCSYLTRQDYFHLPTDRKPLINGFTFFSLALVIAVALITINFVRRYSHRSSSFDDDDSNNHLSEETISSATALLSTSPPNGIIIHSSSKHSTIRHRVRFQTFDEATATNSDN